MPSEHVVWLRNGQRFTFRGQRPADSVCAYWHRSYFCTVCGAVWATWLQPGAERFYALHRSCEEHRAYANDRSGSLIYDAREDIALLPPELLVRELNLP